MAWAYSMAEISEAMTASIQPATTARGPVATVVVVAVVSSPSDAHAATSNTRLMAIEVARMAGRLVAARYSAQSRARSHDADAGAQ